MTNHRAVRHQRDVTARTRYARLAKLCSRLSQRTFVGVKRLMLNKQHRIGIVDGGLHVSLRRAFDDPEAWGMLIADIARHVARIYAQESAMSEDDVLERVRAIFEAEMDAPSDPGSTSAIS